MAESVASSESLPQTKPEEPESKKSPSREAIPKDMPVVNVRDIMMYVENMEGMENKKLIPYVVYLDEQFKEIVQKRRKDARVVFIFMIAIMSMLVIGLIVCGVKLLGYLMEQK
ncbi:hypothetical protein M970_041030 [Encephalitozoon cuniculi EcunIII-L]|uniref:Uncharacterized protein n=1 Tax=Encephalitozoon cuniculi TaxID=6035 RepID=M1K3A4_ENCCN|nr:hypothetical protein ECU04_1080 [Encephalitozoon cuniculi]KMV66312.1 hypothetical protein M970_041030 [Encephalitozoon cuniculi EcunIII-L]UYI27490.1 hypothetical protein J0A71_06g13610 [Encephalitozoon cuniculi]